MNPTLLMDIFNQAPFQAIELTYAFEETMYAPMTLGDMGIFEDVPSRKREIAIAKLSGKMQLIPTSPIGAPPKQLEFNTGDMRTFRTKRLAEASTVYAEELTGIYVLPSLDAQVDSVMAEVTTRAARIRQDMELTHEHQRLGAVQGKVVDADGVTVIDDWFANWGVTPPATIVFDLDVTTTDVRLKALDVQQAMIKASKGAWVPGAQIHALCGDTFYRQLVTHPSVEKWFQNWAAAQDALNRFNDPWGDFSFGGIVWHNYRGTDDGSTLAIPTDRCRFFPTGVPGTFQRVLAPAEFMPWIGQPGQEIYAMTIPDRDRQAWVKVEAYCYPLYICTRPEMLLEGVNT